MLKYLRVKRHDMCNVLSNAAAKKSAEKLDRWVSGWVVGWVNEGVGGWRNGRMEAKC